MNVQHMFAGLNEAVFTMQLHHEDQEQGEDDLVLEGEESRMCGSVEYWPASRTEAEARAVMAASPAKADYSQTPPWAVCSRTAVGERWGSAGSEGTRRGRRRGRQHSQAGKSDVLVGNKFAALALAELECEDDDEEKGAGASECVDLGAAAQVPLKAAGEEDGEVARVLHDLQHIDAMVWAVDAHGGRTILFDLVMSARQTLVERLTELTAT